MASVAITRQYELMDAAVRGHGAAPIAHVADVLLLCFSAAAYPRRWLAAV
jgi:hypothetical protein